MYEFELKYNLNYDFKLAKIQRIEVTQIRKDFSQFHSFHFFWSNNQFIKNWVGPKVLLHLILWRKAKMKQKIVYVIRG